MLAQAAPANAALAQAMQAQAMPAQAGLARGAVPARYVALGDSYTAAPLTSFLQPGSPVGCLRGDRNYPTQVAKALNAASFVDVSCSGAQTKHFAAAQSFSVGSANPPQYDALKTDTTLVTLTVGGNDIGFSKAVRCFQVSYGDPEGSPCKDQLTAGGVDQFRVSVDNAAPKVGAALRGIRERSPQARVLLLNYPLLMPATGTGCFPWVPIAKGDVAYLRDVQAWLNGMLAEEAADAGATLVDTAQPGHDMCQGDPAQRWIEGMPTQWAAPAHPNQNGVNAMARAALASATSTATARWTAARNTAAPRHRPPGRAAR
ncbi:SGNH/GDSL hydrolase family protein [Spirillospora sp. NPDC047279]|uniref:SGNH/GDSL hydrolase family protein n=1 Tax=Spirillospora sp. NPDC047279 TaxID=3155478 RepID=UPI0033F6DC04